MGFSRDLMHAITFDQCDTPRLIAKEGTVSNQRTLVDEILDLVAANTQASPVVESVLIEKTLRRRGWDLDRDGRHGGHYETAINDARAGQRLVKIRCRGRKRVLLALPSQATQEWAEQNGCEIVV